MLIYDVLLCINILLSGFILLFGRICWKIRINRLGGAVLEIIKNKWCQVENLLSI